VKSTPEKKLHPQVDSLIQLLVRLDEPTLAEYAKLIGGSECGGESELDFELEECQSRGWHTHSKSCIDYTRQRCETAEQINSLELSWMRERFSTVGKNYRLIGIRSEYIGDDQNGYTYDLVEVEIGENNFLFFHNPNIDIFLPLDVSVTKVNGKEVYDFR
jgi:hypothetical protein